MKIFKLSSTTKSFIVLFNPSNSFDILRMNRSHYAYFCSLILDELVEIHLQHTLKHLDAEVVSELKSVKYTAA